ncbi:hypothetical protein FACS1894181_09360 [Bacteroidia bacterium]|nr:hypothetical protein FACS1894181_09360 [Bacteroidia bacterium]
MVQDTYFYFRAINNFRLSSYRAIDPAMQGFLEEKWRNYDRHGYYRGTWRIKEASDVTPGEDLKEYADYGEYIAWNLQFPYFFCFMPPCEYLRTWIANRLAASTPEDSAYYFWIQANAGDTEGAMQAAIMIENYRSRIDEAKAMEIFRKAMQFELAILTAATAGPVARSFKNNSSQIH